MARPLQKVRLESGLKLDLNRLCRRGVAKTGSLKVSTISWSFTHTGENIASGTLTLDMRMLHGANGSVRIKMGALDQNVRLVARCRHYGGYQWYFVCPLTNRRASVLWLPPGARSFASRHAWGNAVAYTSQCLSPGDRAHRGMERIKDRLCAVGGFDPTDWVLPPKPKWMRWKTYNREMEVFDFYDAIVDARLLGLMDKFLGRPS